VSERPNPPAGVGLADLEDRYRVVIDSLEEGVVLQAADGSIVDSNPAAEEILGIGAGDLAGRNSFDPHWRAVRPDGSDLPSEEHPSMVALRTGRPVSRFLMGIDRPNRQRAWLSVSAHPLADAPADPHAVVVSFTDVTDAVAIQEALAQREADYRLLAENSSDVITRIDGDGNFSYVSPSVRTLLGYEPTELMGARAAKFVHQEDRERLAEQLPITVVTGRNAIAVQIRHRDGRFVWCEITGQGFDGDGREYVVNVRDISERKLVEQRLAHQALHDGLTGLPNRTLFLDRLAVALAAAGRRQTRLAVLLLDLDRFKVINDSLGRSLGDVVLGCVADRLDLLVRPGDSVARLGGDEFVMLSAEVSQVDAEVIAQRVLTSVAEPMRVDGHEAFVTASVGIAMSEAGPAEESWGTSVDEVAAEALLSNADAAMYRAKALGKARFAMFDDTMRAHGTSLFDTELALRHSLESSDLRVLYQPIVALDDGRVVGAEALVRWDQHERGMVGPSDFIAVAEDSGLIVPLGHQVLLQAFHQAHRWIDHGSADRPFTVAVNLSVRELSQPDIVDRVQAILESTGARPGSMCLEITETALIDDSSAVRTTLDELRRIGVGLAIDDFGTGYSSLSYLRRFPIDVLKIDQSFVQGIGVNRRDTAIVAAVLDLADALDIVSVAEGVETYEQLAALRELGCARAQGHFFAPAGDVADFDALVAAAGTAWGTAGAERSSRLGREPQRR